MTVDDIKNRAAGKTVVTLGEIMLRLSPPGSERFLQSPRFEARFGGGEANVAVSLSILGLPARFVTALPDDEIGRAAVRELRGHGVETGCIALIKIRVWGSITPRGANQRLGGHLRPRAFGHKHARARRWTGNGSRRRLVYITGTPRAFAERRGPALRRRRAGAACRLLRPHHRARL